MYQIKCYVSRRGKNEIQQIYDEGTDDLQAELMVEIEYLAARSRSDWIRPHAAKLKNCKGFKDFFEIRLFADKVQQRPIGYFGPDEIDFTILLWAIEKGNKLCPADWCGIANRRRVQIEEGLATSEELIFGD